MSVVSRQRPRWPRYRGPALAREISKCFNLFEAPRLLIVRLANRDARTSEVMPGETDGRREELGARREGVKRLVPSSSPSSCVRMCSRVPAPLLTRIIIYAYKYASTNNKHAVVSQLWARWRRNAPRAEPEKCFKRGTHGRPRSSAATDAPTCARTPGPYFNHKLMFCLLRICIIVRESRVHPPPSPPLSSSALRFSCPHRPDRPRWHRRHRRRGWYQWRWHVTRTLMDIHEREYTQYIPCMYTVLSMTGYAPVTCEKNKLCIISYRDILGYIRLY